MLRWLNTAGVALALSAGLLGLHWGKRESLAPEQASKTAGSSDLQFTTLPDGQRALLDATGRPVPLLDYQRIASASTISDTLLLEFISPNRIVAFTQYTRNNELIGHRFEGKPRIDALRDIETLLSLGPDLLFVSTLSSETRVQRLREAGLNVFVLGEMRGVDTFLRSVNMTAALLGKEELGRAYAAAFQRRLAAIARDVPKKRRKTAAQLTYYGKKIYGSGRGTSYNDVMTYAGLIDVGAERYEGWPALSIEQVLEMDPEIIITRTGMGEALCTQGALSKLRACRRPNTKIVELPDALINDPGPMMLPSAERVHDAVYGAGHE